MTSSEVVILVDVEPGVAEDDDRLMVGAVVEPHLQGDDILVAAVDVEDLTDDAVDASALYVVGALLELLEVLGGEGREVLAGSAFPPAAPPVVPPVTTSFFKPARFAWVREGCGSQRRDASVQPKFSRGMVRWFEGFRGAIVPIGIKRGG
jgi:hypothetical protein